MLFQVRIIVWVALLIPGLLWPAVSPAQSPLRIAYVEVGPLGYNQRMFQGLARELYKNKLLTSPPPEQVLSTQEYWKWLGQHAVSAQLHFLSDGFYSFSWKETLVDPVCKSVQERLEKRHDVDLILAFGTQAGQKMAKLPTDVAIIVAGVTNALEAGIVPSITDSGQDNLVTILEPLRYRHQLEFFHKVFPFRRLGIAYEDSAAGRNMISLAEIEAAAEELGVELVRAYADLHDSSDLVARRLRACHEQLLEQHVDAVYLTYCSSMSDAQKQHALAPLIERAIPVFSQARVDDVKNGALLSFVDSGVSEGRFAATLLLQILRGKLPRSLSQIFISPKLLAINLRTATAIGWNPSLEVLLSVDEFFD